MNTILKRVISMVLCFVLVAGYLPVGTFATETVETVPAETTAVTEETIQVLSEDAEEPSESTETTEDESEITEPSTEATVPETTEETVPETTEETVPEETEAVILEEEVIEEVTSEAMLANVKDAVDAAIFCSDVHGSSSDLTSVMGGVKTSGVSYSAIGFVGDTCLTVANTTSIVRSALGDTDIAVMFSYASSHDTESGADISTNWNYSGEVEGVSENYLVYTIRETDMQNTSGANTAAPAFTTWYNGLTAAEKALPIFIMSHRPLHDRRDDNAGAATWYTAISAAAETSDIVFFWAHNHTGDNSVDQAAYYVAKDGTETFTVYNGSTVVPNFTYMNAGYINANGQNPARKGIATTVQITGDSLIFQDYNSSGAYSGTYAHNVTVDREFAVSEPAVTLTSITVSGKQEYRIGDELALTVTAVYSDGTTKNVTAEAELSGYNMNVGGKYTVSAKYEEQTATIQITVNPMTVTEWDDMGIISVQATADNLSGLTVTNVYDDPDLTGTFSDYMSVEVIPAGVTAGSDVTYYMEVLDEIPTDGLVLYHVAEDGTLTAVPFTLSTSESGGNYLNFTTSLTGIFAYGTSSVPEGYVLSSIAVSNVLKTDYFVGDDLDMTDPIVTAAYTKEGAEDFPRILSIKDDYATFDGYTISGYDMTAAGAQTVTITYETCTASFDINVWGNSVTVSGVTVALDQEGAEYGVTAANVAESTNEHVAEAIADYIEGDTYVAYDISLVYAENYAATEDTKTVSLPIPEGVNNPVVYYVSNDGATVTNMNAVKGEGVVTFETTHFSTYVVGEGTEIKVPDPETATGSGSTTTTTKKTVYVLTSSISSGNSYLIANSDSASTTTRYLLANNNGSVADTGVTIKSGDVDGDGDTETYIELDDATDELWTVSNSYRFQNDGYYLRYNNGLGLNTSNYTTWSYSSNCLKVNNQNRYLRYNNGWTTTSSSSSASSIYFYVPTEVEVETTTTVSGTYSIAGNPAEVTKVVKSGTTATATLGSTLTFTPTSGSATTTDTSATATYTVVEGGDPSGIISGFSGNTVTFSGNYGKALVKVSYTTDFGVVTNYITVNASEPTYVLDITDGGNVVTGTTIAKKGVTASTTLQLGTKIQYVDEDGAEIVDLPEGATIEWRIPEEYHDIATVDDTGLVSFKGVPGAFYVTATLTVNGKDYTVGVNISATTSSYYVPSDHTTDFPEYPNEGAIRYDKTATAVGNFSQTGIAQVELSMTGVPYTTGSEIDVVVMLDMTGSMSTNGMEAAELATIAFMEKIVKNENGSYNENRIAVYAFNSGSSSPYELVSLKKITSDAELATATTAIKTASDKKVSGGTPFDEAALKCQSVLAAAKTDGTGNDRQQFCVFMSDGGPTAYRATYNNSNGYLDISNSGSGTSAITTYFSGYSSSSSSSWAFSLPSEYYTDRMKADGVTIYTVGLLLQNKPSTPSPYSSMTASTYDSTTDSLTTIGSHYYFTSTVLKQMASDESKYIDIFNVDNADKATAAFETIAKSILQAATDVTVEDKITPEYTMIFDIPDGSRDITGVTDDFYIEFLKYTLDGDHERTGSGTSIAKLYLQNTNGTLSAKDSTAPVFEQKTIGDKGTQYYWSTNASDGDAGVSVTVSGTTYYFVSYGMKEAGYNMTSGAYANGTVDATTNMSTNLVIATPYFVYNAATRMIYWTVDKLDTQEYVLRYFLYLNNSATEVGVTGKETAPGSYLTNDHAYITYTNFNGNECRQEFPKPQLTWNGAQVSYVFYLVNAAGQPINKSGQVVDFANASFVTDVYTTAVVWNKAGETSTGTGELSANWLANDLLPDEYEIYDEKAHYALNVYENADGSSIKNQFTISGGTAAEISASLNSRLKLATTTASVSTTKVYNTKAGEKIYDYGTYTSADSRMKDFDFANTTVAFAVVWQPRLVEDTVVVDYGLDVLINVTQNDILQNKVSGIGVGNSAYEKENIAMNSGVSTTSKLGTAALTLDDNTISIENENQIRFHQGDMQFAEPVVFYYETPVEFWEGSDPTKGYMYSSVTVIPATTIYYEDSFVTLKSFSNNNGTFVEDTDTAIYGTDGKWVSAGQAITSVQQQDRPGKSQISTTLDADNNYGYDSAYTNMATHSLGSGAKITVDDNTRGEATFTFYGTGFDIIGLTSNATGTMTVKVYSGTEAAGTALKTTAVDTFYGYEKDAEGNWVVTLNNPNALYQVPVMKITGMNYGQYTVKVTAGYSEYFDHIDGSTSYDLYLDAIRIYDPTGNLNDDANDAYVQDGEGWPQYIELRNNIIEATGVTIDPNGKVDFHAVAQIDKENGFEDGVTYFTKDVTYAEVASGVPFNSTVTYFTKNEQNEYQKAAIDNFAEGVTYYTVAITYTEVPSDAVYDENEEYYVINDLGGAIFIDSKDENVSIVDYVSYGPNNELYLAAGQSVAFALDQTNANILADVQIAMKLGNGESVSYEMYNAGANGAKSNIVTGTLKTATDLYYGIKDPDNDPKTNDDLTKGTIVIKNNGGGILSITNIKFTYKQNPFSASSSEDYDVPMTTSLFVNEEVATAAVLSLRKAPVAEEIPEPSVPESSEPEENKPTEPVKPGKTDLKKAVDAAKKLKEKDYTKDSFQAVKSALKVAEKVLKNKKASQTQIEAAFEALESAVENLEAKPDTTALKKAVDKAKKLKEKDYTKDSFKSFKNALKAAEKVLKNKNANQAEIDEALTELNEAMSALAKKSSGKNPGKR